MRHILYITILFIFSVSNAQQLDVYSQFLHTGLDYNPAFAGTQSFYAVKVQHKQQFSQVNGSPNSSMLTTDMPFSDNFGGALLVKQSRFQGEQVLLLNMNGAYRMKTSTGEVDFGMRLGLNQRQINYTSTGSGSIGNVGTFNSWDVGAGIQYRDEESFFSLSMINGDENVSGNETNIPRDASRNIIASGAGRFFVADGVDGVFGVVGNYVKDLPLGFHINSSFIIYDFAWVGATYRTLEKQASIQIGVATGHALNIGYAYDFGLGATSYTYTNATHELYLSINFAGKRSGKTLNEDISPIMFLEKKKKN